MFWSPGFINAFKQHATASIQKVSQNHNVTLRHRCNYCPPPHYFPNKINIGYLAIHKTRTANILLLYITTLYYIILYYIILYYIILYYITLRTLRYATLSYVTLYYIILYCIILYYIILYYIILYYIILYYIILYLQKRGSPSLCGFI